MRNLLDRLKGGGLASDAAWAFAGNAVNKGLALVAGILIARFLGRDTYGEYGAIKNMLLYVAVFSTFGVGFSATRHVARAVAQEQQGNLRGIVKACHLIALSFSGLMAVALAVFARQVCQYLEMDGNLGIVRLTALTVVLNAMVTCQTGVIAGLKAFPQLAKVNVAAGIVTFVATVLMTWQWGLGGAVGALMLANALNCWLNHRVIRRLMAASPATVAPLWPVARGIIRFSTPIALQESLFAVSYWAGLLLLVKLADYGQVGLNSAAGQWAGVILFIPGVLQNVMLSHLSGAGDDHRALLRRMLLINLCATAGPFVVVLCLTHWICGFYGPTFQGLGAVLNISILCTVVRCLIQVYVQEYISRGRAWTLFAIRLGRDVLGLSTAWLLIVNQLAGAALLYNIAHLVSSLMCLILLATLNRK